MAVSTDLRLVLDQKMLGALNALHFRARSTSQLAETRTLIPGGILWLAGRLESCDRESGPGGQVMHFNIAIACALELFHSLEKANIVFLLQAEQLT